MAILGGINRVSARSVISKLIGQGFGANKTLSVLRDMGIGYRRTDFLADFAKMSGIAQKAEVCKYIPKKYFPGAKTITDTEDDYKRKYQYIYTVNVKDLVTNTPKQMKISVASDYKLVVGEADDLAKSIMDTEQYTKEIEYDDFTLIAVLQRIDRISPSEEIS